MNKKKNFIILFIISFFLIFFISCDDNSYPSLAPDEIGIDLSGPNAQINWYNTDLHRYQVASADLNLNLFNKNLFNEDNVLYGSFRFSGAGTNEYSGWILFPVMTRFKSSGHNPDEMVNLGSVNISVEGFTNRIGNYDNYRFRLIDLTYRNYTFSPGYWYKVNLNLSRKSYDSKVDFTYDVDGPIIPK